MSLSVVASRICKLLCWFPEKNIKIVATRCHIFRLKCAKIRFRLGLRLRPRWGSLQRSPDPLAGGEGLAAPPQEPYPCLGLRPRFSALWASDFGASLSPQTVPLFPPTLSGLHCNKRDHETGRHEPRPRPLPSRPRPMPVLGPQGRGRSEDLISLRQTVRLAYRIKLEFKKLDIIKRLKASA